MVRSDRHSCPAISGSSNPVITEAMQIHHLGNHWVLSSYLNGVVTVHDFMKPRMTTMLRKQLVKLYANSATGLHGSIEVNLLCTQQQLGTSDCGLFAIANMFSMALGCNLDSIEFDQSKLREHLLHCLNNQEVNMFSHKVLLEKKDVISMQQKISVHCKCHVYKQTEYLIKCTKCEKRYHFKCLNLKDNVELLAVMHEDYICTKCK